MALQPDSLPNQVGGRVNPNNFRNVGDRGLGGPKVADSASAPPARSAEVNGVLGPARNQQEYAMRALSFLKMVDIV